MIVQLVNGQIVKVNPNTGDNPIVKLSVKGHTVTYVRKDGTLSVSYSELIFPLIMAVQKLMNKE